MKKLLTTFSAFLLMALMIFTLAMPAQASDADAFASVFDSTYYAENNPDLKAIFGTDETLLFHHFLTCGMAEGRQGSAEFNVNIYRDNNADLNTVFGNDLVSYYLHYINNGKAEGRIAASSSSSTPAVPATPVPEVSAPPTTTDIHPMFTEEQWSYANRVIELVNIERTAYGLNPVTATYNLSSAAQARAIETSTYYSHTRPNGESCFTILKEYNVERWGAGENIAAGQSTPEEVVTDWMNSPGHRANILNAKFKHLGVGYYEEPSAFYGTYWCQMFIY